jgi:hypothetical protein
MQRRLLEWFGDNAEPTADGVLVQYRCDWCGRVGCLGGCQDD